MDDRPPMITVAIIEPLPDQVVAVEEAFRAAVPVAHSEAGCQLYALHRTSDDPVRFVMVEQWADADALAAHMEGDGIKDLLPALAGKLAGAPQILRLAAIPVGDAKLGLLVA
jgi:quinol monooxygenase YgiN